MRRRDVIAAGLALAVGLAVAGCTAPRRHLRRLRRPCWPSGTPSWSGPPPTWRRGASRSTRLTSRQFKAAIPLVELLAAAGRLPPTVVIHLGTNGPMSDGTCDALVAAVGPRTLVFVNVDLNGTRPWEAGVNATLAACAARHGLRLVDWKSLSTGQPWFGRDFIHLNASGAAAYADLIRSSV